MNWEREKTVRRVKDGDAQFLRFDGWLFYLSLLIVSPSKIHAESSLSVTLFNTIHISNNIYTTLILQPVFLTPRISAPWRAKSELMSPLTQFSSPLELVNFTSVLFFFFLWADMSVSHRIPVCFLFPAVPDMLKVTHTKDHKDVWLAKGKSANHLCTFFFHSLDFKAVHQLSGLTGTLGNWWSSFSGWVGHQTVPNLTKVVRQLHNPDHHLYRGSTEGRINKFWGWHGRNEDSMCKYSRLALQ